MQDLAEPNRANRQPRRFLAALFTIILTGVLGYVLYTHKILFTPMMTFIGLGLLAFFLIVGVTTKGTQIGQIRELEEKSET